MKKIFKNFTNYLIILFGVYFYTGITHSYCYSQSIYNPKIDVQKISEKIIVLNIEPPATNNIIAIKTEKGIVVIDTEASPSLANLVKNKILEVFSSEKIQFVINTHSHGDHSWGNQVFNEAFVVGHVNCLDEMADIDNEVKNDINIYSNYISSIEKQIDTLDQESEKAQRLRNTANRISFILQGYTNSFTPKKPEILFNDYLKMDMGDITLELNYYGKAHSGSDIIIYCPEENLLVTGDVFIHKMRPSYFNMIVRN